MKPFILPNELKLVFDGLIQAPLEKQLRQPSRTSHISNNITLQEDIDTLPFLVEIYIPDGCLHYMARPKMGFYSLNSIEGERPRLQIKPKTSVSHVIGVHILLEPPSEWKMCDYRVMLGTREDHLLLSKESFLGLNMVFLDNSVFFYMGLEDLGTYRDQIKYVS